MLPRRYIDNALPELHTSIPCRYTYSAPPELIPRCLRVAMTPARLQISRPLYLRVATRAAHHQRSLHPHHPLSIFPLDLHTSTSSYLQRASRAPYLHAFTSLHLQRTSRALSIPCRYTYGAPPE